MSRCAQEVAYAPLSMLLRELFWYRPRAALRRLARKRVRTGPSVATLIGVFNETNDVLDDRVWVREPVARKLSVVLVDGIPVPIPFVRRKGMPAPKWRAL